MIKLGTHCTVAQSENWSPLAYSPRACALRDPRQHYRFTGNRFYDMVCAVCDFSNPTLSHKRYEAYEMKGIEQRPTGKEWQPQGDIEAGNKNSLKIGT